jgi:hypothetical protein
LKYATTGEMPPNSAKGQVKFRKIKKKKIITNFGDRNEKKKIKIQKFKKKNTNK